MRPNQNKNRQRGRNGGRKHVNPLSRNYESNGPDVKVRGNASHVAEKYMQLARDAQSSGDSVMAENYLQHAEHYFRIVSSAQQAMNGPRDGQSQDENEFEDDGNDVNSRFSSPQPPQPAQQNNDSESEQAPAAAEAGDKPGEDAAAASAEGEGDQPARKPRERRPRRRRNAGGEAGAASADGNGSQPEPAPELPAFLTGNAAE
jgi:cobalamin biosynthesis protein CobT